ncbi:hypothetical protein HELRODRAFT_88718, partial [Helobdella robusta]|uniref:Uncharacterized protein n=1 Tax=Helobdella robusta TaxID=6412 RepID=T1G757_HELRO
CHGCQEPISEYYLLTVHPDINFHEKCLRCVECKVTLDETKTCFFNSGQPFCKWDYNRLVGRVKCGLCNCNFNKDELVMITSTSAYYHLDCFRCVVCSRVISKGENYSCYNNNIYCQMDYDVEQHQQLNEDINTFNNSNRLLNSQQPHPPLHHHHHHHHHRPSSVRTVLNEKQLHTLRTCYAANPRPDALMKEQLVEMTGLNPRVIRVWFQNKRCKDKKRSVLIKQIRQQHDKVVRCQSVLLCVCVCACLCVFMVDV